MGDWWDVLEKRSKSLSFGTLHRGAIIAFATGLLAVPEDLNPGSMLLNTLITGALFLPLFLIAFDFVEERPGIASSAFMLVLGATMISVLVISAIYAGASG